MERVSPRQDSLPEPPVYDGPLPEEFPGGYPDDDDLPF